ncbi:protein O-mannosyl-transferase TMTC4-like [Haliotis rubra]|uniref:protein O-mannosyl-transferase TMTC4-like n=1 Tax=Haliotis rubra TaxID=36100 RepID=UPI001EE5FD1B|nr:protein O-mannosyl-transferase TMTC4-like [Haliotis rubra]
MIGISRLTPRSSKTNYQETDWDDVLPVPKLSFSVASVLVFCLAVLCFANSHDGEFLFDDLSAVTRNKDLLPETPLSHLFAHDFWGNKLDNTSHKSYRPVTVMTFRWNYAWAGGLHPRGFHVVNIVLHGLVSVIFLAVFSVLMSGYQVDQESARPVFASPRAALLCAVLFAVHPIHTESVAGVVGRADLLCALTFLLSFLLYARSCLPHSCLVSFRPESFSLVSILASMCLCVVSTFCKEQGITVIGICSVYDIIVVCRVHPMQLLTYRKDRVTDKKMVLWVKGLLKRHLILFLTGVLLLATRLGIMGFATPTFVSEDNPHSFVNGTISKILNYNYLYAINTWLLLNPWWLCCDWSMGCIPVITSLADPRILAVIALWTGFGVLFYHCCHGEMNKDQRILIMSLGVLGVPFLPASNLFFRVGFVIAERILYLSCAGFCMLVVLGARQICLHAHSTTKKGLSAGFIVLILLFVLRSIERSQDFKTKMSIYTSGAKVCPLNARIHFNIGNVIKYENTDIGIDEFRLTLKLHPHYNAALINLAIILTDKGNAVEAKELLDRAIGHGSNKRYMAALINLAVLLRKKGSALEAKGLLDKAIGYSPESAEAWMNLGIVQVQLNNTGSSEASFLRALQLDSRYTDCHYNLGNLYKLLGRHEEAIAAWQNATQISPSHAGAWKNSFLILDHLGNYDQAIEAGRKAIYQLPKETDLLARVAGVYVKVKRYQEGEQLFLKALQRDNSKYYIHHNLGVLYTEWGQHDKAEAALLTAQKLNPNDPLILKSLQTLHRKMGMNT